MSFFVGMIARLFISYCYLSSVIGVMGNYTLRKISYNFGRVMEPGSAILATVYGLLTEVDTTKLGGWPLPIVWIIEKFQYYQLVIFSGLLGVAVLAIIAKRASDPWIWEKLKFVLNEFKNKAYAGHDSDPDHYNRVTLFKYKKYSIKMSPWRKGSVKKVRPWSGWLVSVLRSGYTTQRVEAAFHVSPHDPEAYEGMAAKAWITNYTCCAVNLPDLNAKDLKKRDIKAYAKATKCPESMVQYYINKGKSLPRSVGAIPIEVHGNRWGVLVLDSRHPDGVTGDTLEQFSLTATIIGQLLERA